MTVRPVRRLWAAVEPLHAAVYFHPDASAAYKAIGLKGFWMGYFASRAGALGPVGPEVVTAAFYGFAPEMVARAVPSCWGRAAPGDVLAVRRRLAADALRSPVARSGEEIEALAAILVAAARRLPFEGRVVAAASAALPVPEDPLLALWWACTVLREHRGDGHVAALVTHGISPVEAHALKVAAGEASEAALRPHRGWTEEEWAAARRSLAQRGVLDDAGRLTPVGVGLQAKVEDVTDDAAQAAWDALGRDRIAADVLRRLEVVAAAVRSDGAVPFPNAMGLPGTRPG